MPTMIRIHPLTLLGVLWVLAPIGRAATHASGSFKATIIRDAFGVPYIMADSLPDAAFGDGYVQAEDRLGLLMDNVLTATGTRARQLGAGEVERDYRSRVTGARRTAYEKWDHVPEKVRRVFEGYAAGINHYLENTSETLPPTARTVEPQEILAIYLFSGMYRQLAEAQRDLVGRGGDSIRGEGSNGAVLGPSRSVSGNGLMLSDPHTPWSGFNRWYEKHYVTPEVEAHGFGMTGCPLFMFCVTDRIAWTLTRNPADRGDCFTLGTNPENPKQYLFDGGVRDLEFVEERIAVKGQEAEIRSVAKTIHGPVFNRSKGVIHAAGMSLDGEVGVAEQLYRALTSRNLADFKAACALRQVDGANVFYTDVDRNIYYTWWSRLSVRNAHYSWVKAVDGTRRDSLYRGIVPFDQMPGSENDRGGYYQASNAADWEIGAGAWRLSRTDFPDWLLLAPKRTGLPARSQRVVDLITGRPKHSLGDLQEWSLDTHIVGAEWIMPLIERGYREMGNGGNADVDRAMAALTEWKKNPRAAQESTGYAVYREWLDALGREEKPGLQGGGLGEVADIRNTLPMLPAHPELVPLEKVKAAHVALLRATESLVKLYGTPTPKWGAINFIALADGSRFASGAADAASQGMWQTSQAPNRKADGKWIANGGSDGLMVAEMSSPPRVFTMVPYGQSDHPKSPHFADQTLRYTNGEYKRGWFSRAEILAHAKSTVTIATRRP